MKDVKYLAPATLAEALHLLREWGDKAKVLAGGTDLMVDIRHGEVDPDCIIYIGYLEELKGIRRDNGNLRIGALTTHGEVAGSPLVRGAARVLSQASGTMGGTQIRGMGTIGGNIAKASPAGDAIVALTALDASFRLASQEGQRLVPATQFFLGPDQTVMKPSELLTEVVVPLTEGARSQYVKLGRRLANALAIVSVGVKLIGDGDRGCKDVHIALGSVAPTVIRAEKAEATLRGASLTAEAIARASAIAKEETRPIDDVRASAWYRREVSEVLVRRALEQVAA